MSSRSHLSTFVLEILVNTVMQEIEDYELERKKWTCHFRWHDYIHKSPKGSIKIFSELVIEFINEYRINSQKSHCISVNQKQMVR